jgi:cbb3-type cytochrome oxidase subunit 3
MLLLRFAAWAMTLMLLTVLIGELVHRYCIRQREQIDTEAEIVEFEL